MAKRAAGTAPANDESSPSTKRGRGKKAKAPKDASASASNSSPRKRKRKTADAEAEQQHGDQAAADAQLEELLDYPTETPDIAHGYMSHEDPNLFGDDA